MFKIVKKKLKSNAKTKKYLESLPKVYAVFQWAKWTVVEVPWPKKYDKNGMPLVYHYFDCNGCCDEYRLIPISQVSSGAYYYCYYDRTVAEYIRDQLNKKEFERFEDGNL